MFLEILDRARLAQAEALHLTPEGSGMYAQVARGGLAVTMVEQ